MDRLQLYLAGVGVGDRLAAPHHAAEQGAVLPHQVRAAAGGSAQTGGAQYLWWLVSVVLSLILIDVWSWRDYKYS